MFALLTTLATTLAITAPVVNVPPPCAGTSAPCGSSQPCCPGTECYEETACIPKLGGCEGTRFGCCPDGATAAGCDRNAADVSALIGGCSGTRFGCCPDGLTPLSCAGQTDLASAPTSNCTECTKVVAVLESVGPAALNATGHIFKAIEAICKAVPGPSAKLCSAIANDTAAVIEDIERGMNATSVCRHLKFCPA